MIALPRAPRLASGFVNLELRVDARDSCNWGATNGIEPKVLFLIENEPDLLHQFDPCGGCGSSIATGHQLLADRGDALDLLELLAGVREGGP